MGFTSVSAVNLLTSVACWNRAALRNSTSVLVKCGPLSSHPPFAGTLACTHTYWQMNECLFNYYRGTHSSCVCTGASSGCLSYCWFSPVNNSTGRLSHQVESTSNMFSNSGSCSYPKFVLIQACQGPGFKMGYSVSSPVSVPLVDVC